MPRTIGKAHSNPNYEYSDFHKKMLADVESGNYALHHLYSVEATRHLLQKWGWSAEEIKVGCDHITIDVMKASVYVHIPNKIVKRGERVKIRGISRQIKKGDYLEILIERAYAKADPYKLQMTTWDEFVAMGNTGDFYNVKLSESQIDCSCHACQGLFKAFEQDAIAFKLLLQHPVVQGQLPDKHVFAVWKYLNAQTFAQYQYSFNQRRATFLEEFQKQSFELRLNQRSEAMEAEELGF